VTTWIRDSSRDVTFLCTVDRHPMLFSRSRLSRKHLTCVIGGLGVSVLFAGGDSGSDRLGSGGRGGDGSGGGGRGCLSHG
jgi:hypothetical protein